MFKMPQFRRRTIYAIVESHSHRLVEQALDDTGLMGEVTQEPIGDTYAASQIEFFPIMNMIVNADISDSDRKRALRKLTTACVIGLKEEALVDEFKPTRIYVEGSRKHSHPLSAKAAEVGAKVVHLDEGFGRYEKYAEKQFSGLDLGPSDDVQVGRENYWTGMIHGKWYQRFVDMFKPERELMVVGRNHVLPRASYADKGHMAKLLWGRGIDVKILYDTSRIVNAGGAYA